MLAIGYKMQSRAREIKKIKIIYLVIRKVL